MNRTLLIAFIACSCAAPLESQPESEPRAPQSVPDRAGKEWGLDDWGCVANPFQHGVRYMVEHHGQEIAELVGRPPSVADYPAPGSNCTDVAKLPDLDGDGHGEVEVMAGCSWGTYGQLHLLYFSNVGCTRFVGEIVHSELTPLETQHEGVRDLEAIWSNGCAGNDFRWTRFHFRDGAYRVADDAVCEFCPDAPAATSPRNTHPYCQEEAKRRGQ